ncbi:MAG: glucosaminidase domain-containing protein [Enterocloster clostridioformis]|nr:glucosaminidase domain-containing protein [Enterocloster clostridioformis]
MKLVQSILTKNPCYTAGRKITVKGLMLHSVGCPQPKASVFINSWNSPSYNNACVHGFIDGNDGTVYQTLPWNHRGWHCGSGSKGSGNNTHIGVEMCEPACIKYTSGSNFTCSDKATAKAVAKRTYEAAVELFAMLCKQYNLNPTADGVIISHREGHSRGIASNHGDPEHLWNGLGMGYTMDGFRKAVKAKMNGSGSSGSSTGTSGLQASALKNLSEADVIAKVGPLFTADQKTSGILASVSLAQFILESGYGKSELAQNANNCFGMKKSLSGNTWSGSTWDGTSIYTKKTQEYENGAYMTVTADFRKYPSVEKSIADHSAYLLGAKNGAKLRYDGLKGCTDYKKAVQIIKDGGYATSPTYVENLCSIIEKWKLTQYDVANAGTAEVWYRVRKTWADAASQKGAFHSLANAKKCADENAGYSVFDESGRNIHTGKQAAFQPYLVKVSASDLRIRKGPGIDKAKTGKYTGKGIFTIVEEADGPGASKWGLLKAYQKNRDGWISLDHAQKV